MPYFERADTPVLLAAYTFSDYTCSMNILVVDDHSEVRTSIAQFITALGHTVVEAVSGNQAIGMIHANAISLIISDINMPNGDGFELLAVVNDMEHAPPVALMTAFGDNEVGIRALKSGACDYIHKPIDVRDIHNLLTTVESVTQLPAKQTLQHEADGIIVYSSKIAEQLRLCERIHTTPELPAFISGKTGTGKELFARRIHHGGNFHNTDPFIAVNCAAIAPSLFEAELFGYADGAFTGATTGGAKGKLALAAGGTVFLDEIAELPKDQQAKLLRVLESKRWYPIGSDTEEHLQARIVCAANVNLLEHVQSGAFREDLYYRLKVLRIQLPPLCEEPNAIPLLAQEFANDCRTKWGRGFTSIEDRAAALLSAAPWPGNIRQLRHYVEELCMLHDDTVLREHMLVPKGNPATETFAKPNRKASAIIIPQLLLTPDAEDLPDDHFPLETFQAALIAAALKKHHYSPVKAAAYLGISRKVLYTLRKRYGLLKERDDTH